MYGTIVINTERSAFEYKTSDYDSIYDRLMSLTDDHEFSAEVADWAELAPCGEEFYGADDYDLEIFIAEEEDD